jgi:hypothetical protein
MPCLLLLVRRLGMMFYNGFNLLIDLVIGFLVWFFTYRTAWWDGYEAGVADESYALSIDDSPID